MVTGHKGLGGRADDASCVPEDTRETQTEGYCTESKLSRINRNQMLEVLAWHLC